MITLDINVTVEAFQKESHLFWLTLSCKVTVLWCYLHAVVLLLPLELLDTHVAFYNSLMPVAGDRVNYAD